MSDIARNIRHDIFIIVVEFVSNYLCSRIDCRRARETHTRPHFLYIFITNMLAF